MAWTGYSSYLTFGSQRDIGDLRVSCLTVAAMLNSVGPAPTRDLTLNR